MTLILLAPAGSDADDVEIDCDVITPTGANQRFDAELATDVTVSLTVNFKSYRVSAVLANGHFTRLEEGTLSVSA